MAHHHLWANTVLLMVHCSETNSSKPEALQAEHRPHAGAPGTAHQGKQTRGHRLVWPGFWPVGAG